MALSANTVLEVRLTGDDTNGGGFVTGASGTDRSQQDAAHCVLTTASVVHSTTTQITVSGSDYTVTAADVGNLLQIAGGTATAGVYQITAADTTNNRWTLDRSAGTAGQTAPGKMGGALFSPGRAGAIATVSGIIVYIKYNASPYLITTASTNVASGCPSPISGTYWAGYDTNRSLWAWPVQNRPTIQLNVGTATMFGNLNAEYHTQHLILDANSQASSKCSETSGIWYYVWAKNATLLGIKNNSAFGRAYLCEVSGCAATPLNCAFAAFCVAHDNTLTVFSNLGAIQCTHVVNCLSYNNNCSGFHNAVNAINCLAYGNGQHGMTSVNIPSLFINCISEGNTLFGFATNTGSANLINCASYNNGSGRYGTTSGGRLFSDVNGVAGSASFFNNAAGLDFTLNDVAGAGALLRGAGFPTSFPVPANSNFSDIGPIQHQDSAGGGVVAQLRQFGRGHPF